jgi:hypothetical protein
MGIDLPSRSLRSGGPVVCMVQGATDGGGHG